MAIITARGVIIRQSDYGDGNRMLSIFAEDYGIIKAVSYGAKKIKSKSGASTQFLCYGDFELYAPGRDVSTVNSVSVKEGFSQIGEDIVKLALCTYFADAAYALLGENNPDNRILNIFLNTLWALAHRSESLDKVKAAYELKLMSAGGYMPNVRACSCGEKTIRGFDAAKGSVVCKKCGGADTILINEAVYKALCYIIGCEDKRMLAFKGSEALYKALGQISERYVLVHTEQSFKSLDYYKLMRNIA